MIRKMYGVMTQLGIDFIPHDIKKTPRGRRILLAPTGNVASLGSKASMLKYYLENHLLPDGNKCFIDPRSFTIEITDPRKALPYKAGGPFYLGRSYAKKASSIHLDLTNEFAVMIGGTPGCGKSTLLSSLLTSCVSDGIAVDLVDVGGKKFSAYGHELLTKYASWQSAYDFLREVELSMTGPEADEITRVILIDEVGALVRTTSRENNSRMMRTLKELATRLRGYGGVLVSATHRGMAEDLSSEFRDANVCRIAGYCRSEEQSRNIIGSPMGVSLATGQFILDSPLRQVIFHAPVLSEDDIPSGESVTVSDDLRLPDGLASLFLSAQEPDKKGRTGLEKRGFKSNAIDTLASELGVSNAGTNFDRLWRSVQEHYERWEDTNEKVQERSGQA